MRELLLADEHKPLVDYENKMGREAILAVPRPNHDLSLLQAIFGCKLCPIANIGFHHRTGTTATPLYNQLFTLKFCATQLL